MSEREFELYLSLLGGMLHLSTKQRKEIAEELQSHLDERLDDLLASGLSREDAIHACLEEFGDAAGLAAHFTQLSSLRRRRHVMRWTTGTVAVMTLAILSLAYLWPVDQGAIHIAQQTEALQSAVGSNNLPGATSSANEGSGLGQPVFEGPTPTTTEESNLQKIEKKFTQPLESVAFIEAPLHDILTYLEESLEVDIIVDQTAMSDTNVDLETPITIELKYGKISARTLLQFIFEQLGVERELTYTVRDEIVYITRLSNSMTIRVYDCRELLARPHQPDMMGIMGMGVGEMGESDMAGGMSAVQFGGGGGSYGMGGGEEMGGIPRMPATQGDRLIGVIEETIAPSMWAIQGGDSSIQELNGLLVIKSTEEIQREVKALLEQMQSVIQSRSRR